MLRLFTLFNFISAITLVRCQGQEAPCPLPNAHCTCSNDGIVICENVNSIPRNLPNTTTYLSLADNFLGPVLPRTQVARLAALPLEELYLTSNKLELIEDLAFEMLYRVQVLDIADNNIQVLGDDTFSGMKSLTYLYANDAGIRALSPRVFENAPTLQYIDLEDNRLSTIGREFTTLINLTTLLLAENQIEMVFAGAFSGLLQLTRLSLFGNKLNQPYSAWFRNLITNNGKIELDSRINATTLRPNPWLCCPDVSLYYNFLKNLAQEQLLRNPQLNLVCVWPIQLSGRLMTTLSTEELNEVPCKNFTIPTTPFQFINTISNTTTSTNAPIVHVQRSNFLGWLNDVGAFFILLLLLIIGGVLVGLCCCCYRTKKGKQKFHAMASFFKPGASKRLSNVKDDTEMTTQPYKESPPYGSIDPTDHDLGRQPKPKNPAPKPSTSGDSTYTEVVKPADMTYSNYAAMEEDPNEDEIWSKKSTKNPV